MKSLGRHFILECYQCDREHLNNVQFIEHEMNEAAKAANATIIASVFHPFFPHGVSGVVVIAESHLTIHTWPEYGYAAIDVFTCGDEANPEDACEYLGKALQSQRTKVVELKRGEEFLHPFQSQEPNGIPKNPSVN